MATAAITGTGLFAPEGVISNDELVASFNAYVARFNEEHAGTIASGTVTRLEPSSAEFVLKASGIRRRHVIDREGSGAESARLPLSAPGVLTSLWQ
jgi:beta-ketodecanoyl-[acyl-carrier-protein] synthase